MFNNGRPVAENVRILDHCTRIAAILKMRRCNFRQSRIWATVKMAQWVIHNPYASSNERHFAEKALEILES